MKRLLSPQVPLLVFRSTPKRRRSCVQLLDDEEQCAMVPTQVCSCPVEACYECGMDAEEGRGVSVSTSPSKPLHLLITVCMHGNERAGLVAMNELINEDAISKLLRERGEDTKLTVMVGNPRAVEANKRFLEKNLNRILHPSLSPSEEETDLYEFKRARLITRMAETSDQWLDVHTTSAPCTAYALPAGNPQSERLAERLDVGMIINKLAHNTVEGGTCCDWALHHDKTCICVECGQEGTRETIDAAKRIIMSFIVGHRLFSDKKRYESTDRVRVGKGFRYCRQVSSFERVSYNELLAVDDEVGEIRCPFQSGAVIIMPTQAPVIGEEAWYWGSLAYPRDGVIAS